MDTYYLLLIIFVFLFIFGSIMIYNFVHKKNNVETYYDASVAEAAAATAAEEAAATAATDAEAAAEEAATYAEAAEAATAAEAAAEAATTAVAEGGKIPSMEIGLIRAAEDAATAITTATEATTAEEYAVLARSAANAARAIADAANEIVNGKPLSISMREDTLECAYPDCPEQDIGTCQGCPPGYGEDTSVSMGEGDILVCKLESKCEVTCSKDGANVPFTHNEVEYGYKVEKVEDKKILDIDMSSANCTPPDQCTKYDEPRHECPTRDGYTIWRTWRSPSGDITVCCKNDIDLSTGTCHPPPGDCLPVYSWDYFDDVEWTSQNEDGGPATRYDIKLRFFDNGTNTSPPPSPPPLHTTSFQNGGAFAFRLSNFPPVTGLDKCPESEEIYTNLSTSNNCRTVGKNAYCCLEGSDNQPSLLEGKFPSCSFNLVNMLNSVDTNDNYVSSNIIHMYPGYDVFHTNVYHAIPASNAKHILSNDIYPACISESGGIDTQCLQNGSDNYESADIPSTQMDDIESQEQRTPEEWASFFGQNYNIYQGTYAAPPV